MKQLWLCVGVAALLVLASCSNGDDQDGDTAEPVVTPTPPEATTTPADTTPTPSDSDEPDVTAAVAINTLFDGEGPREAAVQGAVIWTDAGARFCEAIMESYPPQCGGLFVVIANPDRLEASLDEAQGVRWTPSFIVLTGRFDGDRFIIGSDDPSVVVASDDEALAEAFAAFVTDPSPEAFDVLPLAEAVDLGLGPEIVVTVDRSDLSDVLQWSLPREEFRGWSGPFSALETFAEPYEITIGAHNRCAGPPEPAPVGYEASRRVSLQPTNATSCLEWWTIDLFMDESGTVGAITIDLFAP